jgi:hypothetical protein
MDVDSEPTRKQTDDTLMCIYGYCFILHGYGQHLAASQYEESVVDDTNGDGVYRWNRDEGGDENEDDYDDGGGRGGGVVKSQALTSPQKSTVGVDGVFLMRTIGGAWDAARKTVRSAVVNTDEAIDQVTATAVKGTRASISTI